MALCSTGLSRRQVGSLYQKGKEIATSRAEAVLVSATVAVPLADPIDLFEQGLRLREKVTLWANPGGRYIVVGLGQAAEMTEAEQLVQRWQQWLSTGLREGPVEP